MILKLPVKGNDRNMFRNAIGAAKDEFASMCIRLLLDFSVSVQNRKDLWYTIKNLLQMKRGGFLDNHKKSVLWVIDIAKISAIVCGATLLGILFVKSGFPETNIVVIYIFAVLLVARFTKGYLRVTDWVRMWPKMHYWHGKNWNNLHARKQL